MKTTAEQPFIFENISDLMRRLEQPKPLHPLVALVRYGSIKVNVADVGQRFALNFYKISFKIDFKGQVRYGQGYYDFEEGGLAFLAPNQIVTAYEQEKTYEGYTFFFHPDFIRNYPLGKRIHTYGFFSYAVSEALFLSEKEKFVIASVFNHIALELENNIDQFSQDVMVSQIELLLNYSNRFYHRQFITRKTLHNEWLEQMNSYLAERLDNAVLSGLPNAQELADYLKVSPRYLTDMLKTLTGQNTQQYIHTLLMEKAKDMLSLSQLNISEIAYKLGFEHPQSFHKLFKQKMGMSPVAFRQSFE
ncbi:AraC family transcriptional regulator [Cytophagaceae bacterium DM2B3-1]|uniref:AraC family transcriptional regulator n=1 Tax=Xanthocytophaga flava TaxID=3048013 RepID=A0ABT7CEL3_9BACT|nr:AraC family transcriptional regulator [Xanthocytophaga flavus]MDJ1492164.1 AraC family transcriptional regulator [Xanthocytophaga flavus]